MDANCQVNSANVIVRNKTADGMRNDGKHGTMQMIWVDKDMFTK